MINKLGANGHLNNHFQEMEAKSTGCWGKKTLNYGWGKKSQKVERIPHNLCQCERLEVIFQSRGYTVSDDDE